MELPSKHDILMFELEAEIEAHRKFADNLQLAYDAIAKTGRVRVDGASLGKFSADIKVLVDGLYMDDLKVDLRNVTHEYTYTTEVNTRRNHSIMPVERTGPACNFFSIPRR